MLMLVSRDWVNQVQSDEFSFSFGRRKETGNENGSKERVAIPINRVVANPDGSSTKDKKDQCGESGGIWHPK